MQRRGAHQDRVIEQFFDLARSRLDLKWQPSEPEFETVEFVGDWIAHADAWELWLKWEEQGFMPDPGGYWDQHPLWRAMIHEYRRIYRGVAWVVRQEIEARDGKRD